MAIACQTVIFDGVQIAMQVTPRDAAKAAEMATPFKSGQSKKSATSKAAPVRGVTMTPPHYPKDEVDQKVEGRVILIVDVAADGSVTKVAVERGSRNSNLDREAVKAAAGWKFTPKIEGGKAVASQVRMPVDFRMDDPDAKQS